MPEIHETVEIQAPADEVWSLAGDPGRIGEWVPALAASVLEDDRRVCATADGADIVERVLERSDEQRYYVYEITSSPFPLRWFRSQLSVHGHDGHSHVSWLARFEAESPELEPDLAGAFERIYRDGLTALQGRFESGPDA